MTARGQANLLTRTTAVLAVLFFITSIALALMAGGNTNRPRSILDAPNGQAPLTQPGAPAEAPKPSVPLSQ